MKKKQTKRNSSNTLFTIYGARLSKSGERVNVSLVRGDDEDKEWATVSIKTGKSSAKVKAKIDGDFAIIKVPMLKLDVDIDDDDDDDDDALKF